jgi:hypothetical protein
MATSPYAGVVFGVSFHPNELDQKRIERALKSRRRYRYVSPLVQPVDGGYRIESPCCSRNIDTEGGVIDIALLEFCTETRNWRLHRKDHARNTWEFEDAFQRLADALAELNTDPGRKFWQ